MEQNQVETLIGQYILAWSEPDPEARRKLLETVWTQAGVYTDPVSHAPGREALDQAIAQFLAGNPGAKFTLTGKIDHHHEAVRFYWTLHLANGVEIAGMDYGEVTLDGKLAKIVGFF